MTIIVIFALILRRVSAREHKCNMAADKTYDKLWAHRKNSIKQGNVTQNKKGDNEYDTLNFSKSTPDCIDAKQREYTEIAVPGFKLPKMKNKQEDEEWKQCGTVTSMRCREVEGQVLGNGESLYDVARKVPREKEADTTIVLWASQNPLTTDQKSLNF